ncbi:uncharacterized protein LOC125955951 [Anopheles darlingi]|uniref:uncharacterized protein LOC125955951 n=1 Tax=Anopheles darlingi TaxID=43151 RepID=UPI00210049CC|nr:uncharacterized protein LOC125955951 [Anopheles darlingi]
MSQRRNYTNRLTHEVLCMVFDRLDLENVKNASLTCRRWNNIIFSSGYVDRFSLNLAIMDLNVYPEPVISEAELDHNIINYRSTYDHLRGKKKILIKRHFPCRVEPDKQNQIFKQLVEIITKTKRRYRHLCWDIDEFMNRKFQTMWQAIHPKLTNNLATLEIYFTGASLLFVYDTLAEAIPLMPKLNELALLDEEYHAMVKQDRTLIFRSQTIERLTLNFDYRSSIEMPKLRFYEGAFNALHLPQAIAESTKNKVLPVRHGTSSQTSAKFPYPE